jgi:hypothetical protein
LRKINPQCPSDQALRGYYSILVDISIKVLQLPRARPGFARNPEAGQGQPGDDGMSRLIPEAFSTFAKYP